MHCTGLTTIVIPEGVIDIMSHAFYGCTKLESLVLPSSLTTIAASAFEWCKGLVSITFPANLTSVGWDIFRECDNLKEIHFNGTVDQWNAIQKDEKWDESIDEYIIYCTDGEIKKN